MRTKTLVTCQECAIVYDRDHPEVHYPDDQEFALLKANGTAKVWQDARCFLSCPYCKTFRLFEAFDVLVDNS